MFSRIDRNPNRNSIMPVLLFAVMSLSLVNAAGQKPNATTSAPEADEAWSTTNVAPVVVDGVTLFYVRGVMAFPAEKRAQEIAQRIQAVAADHAFSPQSLSSEETPIGTRIMAGKFPIMTLIDPDARLEGIERPVLAHVYTERISDAIEAHRRDREPRALMQDVVYAILATLFLLLILWGGHWLYRRFLTVLDRRFKENVQGLHIQSLYFVHTEQLWNTLNVVLGFLWGVAALAAFYIYLHYVLSLFPWTRGASFRLLKVLMDPLRTLGIGLLQQIPNLVFLVILGLVTWYLLKLIRLFFDGIENGAVTFAGFDPGWAKPTYRLVRVLVIAFAIVVAYPYIPGSDSAAFKGVSLFIGVVFSLGSTSIIGNMLAGYTMVYRRTFKLGDWVKIGNHIGSVEQTGVMVTTLRTPKNEIVVVPNSMIINGEVINYSMLAKKHGLILHTTVSIGYETPWRQVEAMLIEAAGRTPALLREPGPFVLHKELGDFAVTYELNTYCDQPLEMLYLYTALHQNILDVFNEYGVQIMTPAYIADPVQAKVVPKEQWYLTPAHPPNGGESCSPKDEAA